MTSRRALRANPVSIEASPIAPAVAPPSKAFTFAQTRDRAGRVITLLVAAFWGEAIDAVDLTRLGARRNADVFDVAAAIGDEALVAALEDRQRWDRYAVDGLLPSGGDFDRHIATGTNFAEHAREAGVSTVFHFPKFGRATPARTTLVVQAGVLMDYEVEISVRFDREIRTMDDFEAAAKGFFLCGDFTDRAALMRRIDVKDIASGHGFSDAKSGTGFFPTGPFLVIPRDWRSFIADERIVTRVNGELRQDARGREMILDFEALVAKALARGAARAFRFEALPIPLMEGGVIPRGAAVMSGTSEGVIFMPPVKSDRIGGLVDHVLRLRFLRGVSVFQSVVERFIINEARAGRYLQVGDEVEHISSTLGALTVELVAP